MRRHGQHAPYAAAAIPHFNFKPRRRFCVALVLRGDLLKRRPHQLAIDRVTSHAGVLPRDVHGISGRSSGRRRVRCHRAFARRNQTDRGNHATQQPPPHFAAGAGLPGCTSEFLTGAGDAPSSGLELTDESGTAPTVGLSSIGVTAGALAPDAAAADNACASSGLMYWNTFTTCATPGTCAATFAPAAPLSRVTRPIRYTVPRSHTTL